MLPSADPSRAQQHVQQELRTIVVDVAHKNRIQRHAQERAIHRRKRQHPPRPQRRKHVLDPLAVSVEKMFDLVQVSETSLREKWRAPFAVRYSPFARRPSSRRGSPSQSAESGFAKSERRQRTANDVVLRIASSERQSANDAITHAPSSPQSTPARAAANPSPPPAIRPLPPDCPANSGSGSFPGRRTRRGSTPQSASCALPRDRIRSAIPSTSRSHTARVASGVTSRGAIPVPPVVTTRRADWHNSISFSWIAARSSATTLRATT